MTTWPSFYQYVLPFAPGCPMPSVDLALRDAAREFCRRSKYWVENATAVVSDGTTRAYSFVFTAGSELVKVTRCTVAGVDWTVTSAEDMPPDWLESAPNADALFQTCVVKTDRTGYVLFGQPASGDKIVIYQSLMPTMSATGVGDIVYTDFGEQLAEGAKKRLLAQPKKPWTDVASAGIAAAEFERAIHAASGRRFAQGKRRVKKAPL